MVETGGMMHEFGNEGLLAVVNKHHVIGIVAIVAGVVLAVLGATKVIGRTIAVMLIPVVGLVVVVVGILLYLRTI